VADVTTAVLALVAAAAVVGAVSAVTPFLPVEAYVAGAAVTQPPGVALAVAVAAGLGQAVGKTTVFQSARVVGGSPRLERLRAGAAAATARVLGPPAGAVAVGEGGTAVLLRATAGARARRSVRRAGASALGLLGGRAGPAVVLASAAVSLPPLTVVAFVSGCSSMRRRAFVPACFAGRTARFCGIALLPALVPG